MCASATTRGSFPRLCCADRTASTPPPLPAPKPPSRGAGRLTVDHDGGAGAAPLGHDVAGHARVIPRIGQLGLGDDEAVVARFVGAGFGDEGFFIFQPFHLKRNQTRDQPPPLFLSCVVCACGSPMLSEFLTERRLKCSDASEASSFCSQG